MTSSRLLTSLLALSLAACAGDDLDATTDPPSAPTDVAAALARLPDATVVRATPDGVPLQLAGDLGQVAVPASLDRAAIEATLQPVLPALVAPFRLHASSLGVRKVRRDERGAYHVRLAQRHHGIDVVGGDLVVHIDAAGTVYAVNGTARGDLSPKLGAAPIGEPAALARVGQAAAHAGLALRPLRTVYLMTADGTSHRAYEIEATGTRAAEPVRDLVYVDVDTGAIAAVYPQVHGGRSRWVKEYRAENYGDYDGYEDLPDPLLRREAEPPVGQLDVDGSYDNFGQTYDAYKQFFGRDSYDGAGATMYSYVLYGVTCNAFWMNSQFVFGIRDGVSCGHMARNLEVTAHEFTHAVTDHESRLVYSGESGGINESLSDIFGAFVETWVNSGGSGALTPTANTWLHGEDDVHAFSRNLCDPAADGDSLDEWTSTAKSVDVHYSSGIGNLMFCLLARGGTHPRGKTAIPVAGIGMAKAIRILYKAQVDILTSNSDYLAYRAAMIQAATELAYDDTVRESIGCAFAAVNVGAAPPPCAVGTPAPVPSLRNGVGVTAIDMAAGDYRYWKIDVPPGLGSFTVKTSGGTGHSTLYVLRGQQPTTTTYACRASNMYSNTKTCLFTSPAAGTYHVMEIASTDVADMTLTASYVAASGTPYFYGSLVLGMSGAAASTKLWRVYAGGGRSAVTVTMANGSGDADLYVRFGSAPTTGEYDCRPYTPGNNESCTSTSTALGDHYIMVRGYKAYDGVSLVVSY